MLLLFSWQSQFFRNQYSSHLFFPGTLIKPWYPIKNVHGCSKSQVSASLKRPNHNYIRAVQRNIKVKSTQNMKRKERKNEKCTIQSKAPGPTINHTSLLTYSTYWMHFRVFWKTVGFFPHSWYCLSLGGWSASHFTRTFPLRVWFWIVNNIEAPISNVK